MTGQSQRSTGQTLPRDGTKGGADSVIRVLIIDDDEVFRASTALHLRKLGVGEVVQAHSGRLGIAAIDDSSDMPFDLVICDLQMPESDGLDFLRMAGMRSIRTPLLMVSSQELVILRAVELIATAHGLRMLGATVKPINSAALSEVLTKCKTLPTVKPLRSKIRFTEEELRAAIAEGQFEGFYQPKVSLKERLVSGCEVLARWNHPVHGLLPANMFIDQIQVAGLMPQLTRLIFRCAADWCTRWREQGLRIPVSVNLSMSLLEQADLPDQLLAIVHDAGLHAGDFIVEVTETLAMSDFVRCMESMVRLRLSGFGLSIDDLGTGFSSIQQLARVPYTELKSDRSFVKGATNNAQQRAVLESSVAIARKLGIASVAEGIDNQADLDCVTGIGYDFAQGYFFADAMPGSDFAPWAAAWLTGKAGPVRPGLVATHA